MENIPQVNKQMVVFSLKKINTIDKLRIDGLKLQQFILLLHL